MFGNRYSSKFCINLIFLCLLALLSASSCSLEDHNERNFVAYSWSEPSQDYANIIPFYWLKLDDFQSMDRFVKDAKKATDKMPAGHRVLFSWDLHRSMGYQVNGDFLHTPQGDVAGCNSENGFTPYRSLWWENGVADVTQKFDDFFKQLKNTGAQLDVFVLDYEQGFTYWHLLDLVEKEYDCSIDYYLDALQNDPRFSQVKQELGFEDLKSLNFWYENDNHLKWAAYTWSHLAGYINSAVYEPMKRYYPDADFSNYGYYYQSPEFDFPDIHGSYRHRYTQGIHVGTHQSREIYGWMNFPGNIKLAGVDYLQTPFNAFRFALNKLRAMLLSSELPVSPWVAYKSFTNSLIYNNDYYQELVFHILLSGVDYLLYWNPSKQTDFSNDDDRLINDLIDELNVLVADQNIEFNLSELANWLDDIIISKVQLESGKQLWRLSANLELDENIDITIVQANPAKIKVKETLYSFDSMQVMQSEKPLSNKGLWLISN